MMKMGNLVPVCGSTKRRPSKATYHRFNTSLSDEDEYYSQGTTSISMLQPIPTLLLQPKLRLSTSFLKRFRDAYVDAMLCFAERAVHFNNNGEVFFLKKIQDDDVRYLTASLD